MAGLALGGAGAFAELGLLLAAGLALLPVLAWPDGRAGVLRRVRAAARRLAEWQRRRIAAYLGGENAPDYDGGRAIRYLLVRWPVGLLGLAVLGLLALGAASALSMLLAWTTGFPWAFIEDTGGGVSTGTMLWALAPGVVLLYLNLTGVAGVAGLDRELARRVLGPSPRELLERRITELAATRAGVVAAVDSERRRIERDLHDGVQQRLVALGMLLGRARRQGDSELLEQAHEESREVLRDLREVAWRIYPTALDSLGLQDALAAVAERSAVPVRIGYGLVDRPPGRVETAAYFVVCEAVTNAAKHAGAERIDVSVRSEERKGPVIVVRVSDDGVGGADPAGGGLSGLARRVAALDGRFSVHSPAGGPTVVSAELPCG
ncbi:ATPase [Microtetraspora sp. NBRC 13810]|uniref:sensor histidine kinase n=1 Tax=Microtetraspora sp. NBRC 13810 TaxID=3030990 RepID=UPI0024A4A39D|nr:histidine kinase [Microtetraspora sp. NBRC 13810]GLW12561.1 ATPase [Microtetraspora sp. NBRC 13810]